jgi:hypothetical protein
MLTLSDIEEIELTDKDLKRIDDDETTIEDAFIEIWLTERELKDETTENRI